MPRIFYCLNMAKNFYMIVPFRYNFRSLSKKIHCDFLKFNFSYVDLYFRLIFLEKGKLKFSDSKNVMERGITKILTFLEVMLHETIRNNDF